VGLNSTVVLVPESAIGFSWVVVAGLILGPDTSQVTSRVDVLVCGVLLADFLRNLWRAPSRAESFFKGGGWLDLLDIQRERFEQNRQLVQAQTEWRIYSLQLQAMIGGLDSLAGIEAHNDG